MLKRASAIFLTTAMSVTALAPLSQVTAAGAVNFDEDSAILLQLLQIEADTTDPLYQDPEFIDVVNAFSGLNDDIDAMGQSIIDILDQAMVLADELQDVDDPRFAEYKLTLEEAMEAKDMIDEIKASISQDGKGLSDILWETALEYQTDDYSYAYPEDKSVDAYANADTYYAVPGQTVTLYDYTSFDDYVSNSSVIWIQSAGPQVELRESSSTTWLHDREFTMPNFDGSSVNYVQFDLIASQNGETSTSTVTIYLDSNGEQAIRNLYWTLLGREADEGGLKHWMNEYQNGMSIEQIEQAFKESNEYKNRF